MLKDFFFGNEPPSTPLEDGGSHGSTEAFHGKTGSNRPLEEDSVSMLLHLHQVEVPQPYAGKGNSVATPAHSHTVTRAGSTQDDEGRDLAYLLPREMLNLREEFLSFLKEQFDTAYNLALEQARKRQEDMTDGSTSDLVFAHRQEQQMIHAAELQRRREHLLAQLQEEQQKLRHTTYRRQVDVLLARKKEREAEYQLLLKRYYTLREEERRSLSPSSCSTAAANFHGDSSGAFLAANEEALCNIAPESMTREQLVHLRGILRRLRNKARCSEKDAQHASSLREMEISTVAARVQQQYLSIIAEQHQELRMLQRWYGEMQQLGREAENCIEAYAEQSHRRRECLQRDKGQRVTFPVSQRSGGSNDTGECGKGEIQLHQGQRERRPKELFDFLL